MRKDGESGFRAAHAAGMQVVDVRDLPGYPLPDGLKAVMQEERARGYPWL